MSKLFSVSADDLLAINEKFSDKLNQLKFGMYLVEEIQQEEMSVYLVALLDEKDEQ